MAFDGTTPLPVEATTGGVQRSLFPADAVTPVGKPVIPQSGVVIATTSASGTFTLTFPAPFPSGVLSVTTTPDNASGAVHAQTWQGAGVSTSGVIVLVRSATGAPLASTTVRVSYVAKGW